MSYRLVQMSVRHSFRIFFGNESFFDKSVRHSFRISFDKSVRHSWHFKKICLQQVCKTFLKLKKKFCLRRLVRADKDKSSIERGWVSIDRGVIAALLSTTPPTVHKSSTDDLGPPLCQVGDQESCSHLQQTTKFRGSGWSQRLSFPEQKGGPTVSLPWLDRILP